MNFKYMFWCLFVFHIFSAQQIIFKTYNVRPLKSRHRVIQEKLFIHFIATCNNPYTGMSGLFASDTDFISKNFTGIRKKSNQSIHLIKLVRTLVTKKNVNTFEKLHSYQNFNKWKPSNSHLDAVTH